MTATHNAGPQITFGYAPGTGGSNPEAGPSATYQADSILDPRWPVNPGVTGPGHVKGFLNHPYPTLVDGVPVAKSNTLICPALAATTAIAVAAQAFPLQTTNAAGRAVNIPVVPFGQTVKGANAVLCLTLDPGHTTCTATSGSSVLTVVLEPRLVEPNSWIGIVGAGTGGTLLVAKVISYNKVARTVQLDRAAGATAATTPIIIMDPSVGASAWPGINSGAVQLFDCYSALSRAASVTAGASDAGYVVTVSGYDVFLNPMSEQITSVASSTVNGKKAFKYISGVTVARGAGGATVTSSLAVGTSDIFGINLRSEKWEYMNVFFGGSFVSTNTGWTAGLAFNVPATQSGAGAADVRGTYAVQAASDGVQRLAIFCSVPIQQLVDSTFADFTSLHGPAQV